jgi:hypothetical protein
MPVAAPNSVGRAARAGGLTPPRTTAGLAWRPGLLTLILLTIATVVGAWIFAPPGPPFGDEARISYAAASVSDAGGNPYDFELLRAEQKRLGDTPARHPYGYPPVLTATWQLLLPLGARGFYLATAALMLLAGFVAYRLCAVAIGWRDVGLGAWALIVSGPFIVGEWLGTASNLVFLAWALGFFALTRGRPVAAGVVLALTLVNPPVAIAMLLALGLAAPAGAGLLFMGFGAGAALFMALNLLALGPGAVASWLETLVPTLETNTTAPGSWSAGVATLLTGHAPAYLGVVAALVLVAMVLAVALRDGRSRAAFGRDPLLRIGVFTAALLVASPYLGLGDLVLETVPLMVLASRRLSPAVQAGLVAWGLGVLLPLGIAIGLGTTVHRPGVTAPAYGAALAVLILLGLSGSLRPPRLPRQQRQPARPWGPVPSR